MASNTARVPLLRALARRSFVSEAAAKPVSCAASDVKVTSFPNKMVVASADCNNHGLVKISIAVRAGSRYESPDNYGVSSIIRSSAGLSTHHHTKFGIIRNLQQMGSTLTATSDRETIVYTLETTCNKLVESCKYLKSVITESSFKPWELTDNIPRIQYELATVPHTAKLMDDLHKAAYRTGLGNSIFVKDYNIKRIGQETIQHFVNNTFLASRTAVAGVGIDHASLVDFANDLNMETGAAPASGSKYTGGEIRHDADINMAHVAYAAESSALTKKDVFSFAVLRYALGGGCSVKWGAGVDPLSDATRGSKSPAVATAFSAAHSDSGLFGILISASPENIGETVRAAVKSLKSGVRESDVARGKALLKADILYNGEDSGALAVDIAIQSALIGTAKSPMALADAVDQVTTAQVQDALKKVVDGGKTMASIGNLHNVPFLEDLQ